jgi:hypothetical protein
MQGFLILKQVVRIVTAVILMDRLLFYVKRGVIIHERDFLGLSGRASFPGRNQTFPSFPTGPREALQGPEGQSLWRVTITRIDSTAAWIRVEKGKQREYETRKRNDYFPLDCSLLECLLMSPLDGTTPFS